MRFPFSLMRAALVAIFTALSFIGGPAQAEEQEKPISPFQNSEHEIRDLMYSKRVPVDRNKLLQMFRDTTQHMGIEASEKDMRHWVKQAAFPEKDYFERSLQDNFATPALPDIEPKKVITHLRSTQGIPLPVKGEYPFPGGPQASVDPRQILSATLFGADQMKKIAEQKPLPRLPRCADNKTERAATKVKDDDIATGVLMDFIFLDEALPQLPNTDVFGNTPIVVNYGKKDDYYLAMISQGLRVPCLPYRVRATIGYIMKDQGLNALKNYDENQLGKGELHEFFKQKYGLIKKRKK